MIYPEDTGPETNQPDPQAQPPERIGFCQHCGKPLTRETIRKVGNAVYCEPCLAERLSGAPGAVPPPPSGQPAQPGYTPVAEPVFTGWTDSVAAGTPNPGLAALLGFIPGVGAMYNGQYAKGVVHLVVFAVLVSLSNENGLFGIFIAGWIFYMVIEAHHTARARRDGAPLPNPFGLNDLGERMGFGKSWPTNPPYTPPADPNVPPPAGYPPYTQPYASQPSASWGAPRDTYATPPVPPYNPAYQPYAPVPPVDPAAYPAYQPPTNPYLNRFPGGAVWLIGLGVIFLLANSGLFNRLGHGVLSGLFLIGLGFWIFFRRYTSFDLGMVPVGSDGSVLDRLRIYRALRASIWVIAAGLILLFNGFRLLSWSHMWPWFIILIGVLTIVERTTYNTVAATPPYPGPVPTPAPAASAPTPETTSIVPFTRRDEEER